MNHQDIADRLRDLGNEESAAFKAERQRIDKERESLVELCGGMGHIYADGDPLGRLFGRATSSRCCVVCGKEE